MQAIGIAGCIFATVFLIFTVYKGYHIAYMSIVCALIIVLTNQMNLVEAFSSTFVTGASRCANMWFYFVFGVTMAELYGKSGAGQSIARTVIRTFCKPGSSPKKRRAVGILSIYMVGVLMLFGGFEAGALPFILLPIATAICAESDIPRRFMPGLLLGTAATIGSTTPGSPQAHNQIASSILGTPTTAALIPGLIASVVVALCINLYMNWAIARDNNKGIHFDYGPLPQADEDDPNKRPHFILSILPLLSIFILYNFAGLHLYLCMLFANVFSLVLFWKYFEGGHLAVRSFIRTALTRSGGMLLVMASFQGFSAVFSASPSFQPMLGGLVKISAGHGALFALILAMALIAVTSGNAPSALTFGLPILGPIYTGMGVSASAVHRVAIFAAVTLDTLPTNGGILFMLEMCGVDMKDGYPAVGMNTVVCTGIGAIVCALLCTLFPGLA